MAKTKKTTKKPPAKAKKLVKVLVKALKPLDKPPYCVAFPPLATSLKTFATLLIDPNFKKTFDLTTRKRLNRDLQILNNLVEDMGRDLRTSRAKVVELQARIQAYTEAMGPLNPEPAWAVQPMDGAEPMPDVDEAEQPIEPVSFEDEAPPDDQTEFAEDAEPDVVENVEEPNESEPEGPVDTSFDPVALDALLKKTLEKDDVPKGASR